MPVPRTSCDIDWGGREKRLGYLCIFGQRLVINAEMASAVYAARADASNEDRTPEHGQKNRRDDGNPNSVRQALWRMQLGDQAFQEAYADAVGDYVEARALAILLCHEVEKVLLKWGESIPTDKRVRASVSEKATRYGRKALPVEKFTRDLGGLRISKKNLSEIFTREFLRLTESQHVWLSPGVSEACRKAARYIREGYLAEIRQADEWPDYYEAKIRENSSDGGENHDHQPPAEGQSNGPDEDEPNQPEGFSGVREEVRETVGDNDRCVHTPLAGLFDGGLRDKADEPVLPDSTTVEASGKEATEGQEGVFAGLPPPGSWGRFEELRSSLESNPIEPSPPASESNAGEPNQEQGGASGPDADEEAGTPPRKSSFPAEGVSEPGHRPSNARKDVGPSTTCKALPQPTAKLKVKAPAVILLGLFAFLTVFGISGLSLMLRSGPRSPEGTNSLEKKPAQEFTYDCVIAPLPDPDERRLHFNVTLGEYIASHAHLFSPWKIKFLDANSRSIRTDTDAEDALRRWNARAILWAKTDASSPTSSVRIYRHIRGYDISKEPTKNLLELPEGADSSFKQADQYSRGVANTIAFYLGQVGIWEGKYDQVAKMIRAVRDSEPKHPFTGINLLEAVALANLNRHNDAFIAENSVLNDGLPIDSDLLYGTVREVRAGILFEAGYYEKAYKLMLRKASHVDLKSNSPFSTVTTFPLTDGYGIASLLLLSNRETFIAATYREPKGILPDDTRAAFKPWPSQEAKNRRLRHIQKNLQYAINHRNPGIYVAEEKYVNGLGIYKFGWKRPLRYDTEDLLLPQE